MKENQSGTDREGIRKEGRDSGRRERGATLKTELQRDEGDPMTGKYDRDERRNPWPCTAAFVPTSPAA